MSSIGDFSRDNVVRQPNPLLPMVMPVTGRFDRFFEGMGDVAPAPAPQVPATVAPGGVTAWAFKNRNLLLILTVLTILLTVYYMRKRKTRRNSEGFEFVKGPGSRAPARKRKRKDLDDENDE